MFIAFSKDLNHNRFFQNYIKIPLLSALVDINQWGNPWNRDDEKADADLPWPFYLIFSTQSVFLKLFTQQD